VTALATAGFDRRRSALFLWEGVTNYLTAEAVDGTLDFTYVHAGVLDGTIRFPGADRWLRNVARLGEPWTFGLLPERVPQFLADRGFRLVRDESTAEAGARLFAPMGRSERASELYRIAVARFGDEADAADH
jgi:O-methyltransferase involved in polyketide biosynthesis